MDRADKAGTCREKPLGDAIMEYLMACEVEGKSPRTVQAYDETLRDVCSGRRASTST